MTASEAAWQTEMSLRYLSRPLPAGKWKRYKVRKPLPAPVSAGDRYSKGEGSFNRKRPGRRQVTLINSVFFNNSRL